MKFTFDLKTINLRVGLSILIPLLLYWIVWIPGIPYSFTHYFQTYFFFTFLSVLILYYLVFRFSRRYSILMGLGLTLLLFALTLSYQWSSGFSDNFIIGGLLPYKDAKNYYYSANLILNGLPLAGGLQGSGRPLFPGLLSSLLLFSGQNLKIMIALLVELTGIGFYLSVRAIHRSMGAFAASLYSSLMVFYIQPFLGYTLSESLGFMMGCIAFSILWLTAQQPKWWT